jgi:hypothetical protein
MALFRNIVFQSLQTVMQQTCVNPLYAVSPNDRTSNDCKDDKVCSMYTFHMSETSSKFERVNELLLVNV